MIALCVIGYLLLGVLFAGMKAWSQGVDYDEVDGVKTLWWVAWPVMLFATIWALACVLATWAVTRVLPRSPRR